MTLPSIAYALFLLSVVGIFWTLESLQARLWLLVVASIIFYASLQVQYLLLMVALMLVTFFIGNAIMAPMDWRIPNQRWQLAEKGWNRRRTRLLWLGIAINVLLLLGFKYLDGIFRLLGWGDGTSLLVGGNDTLVRIIMPLGSELFCV
jgi:alginate O-acetyltransferase complex protein AlgI